MVHTVLKVPDDHKMMHSFNFSKRSAETQILQMRAVTRVEGREKRSLSLVHLPTPAKEAPPQAEEIMRRITEVEQLKGVGGHLHCCQPNSWPRWLQRPGHLHWVKRSQSGGSSDLSWEAKPPQKEFLQAGKVKKTRKYWPGTVALYEIWQFQKST